MKPILICQNCAVESAGTIVDYFDEHALEHRLVKTFEGEPLPAAEDCGPVISLGCPESVTEYGKYDFLKNLYGFVSELIRRKQPYLGICFGGQLLARIMGARVERNDKPEIGLYEVRLTEPGKSDPIFAGFPESFPVFHWHADRFRVPFGCELLAEGDDCKYQAFRSGNAVAVQFHLETTPDEVSLWCDIYADELTRFGGEKSRIVTETEAASQRLRRLNFQLLDNFLNLA